MENLIEACVVHICECMQRPHIEAKVSPSKDMYDFFDTGSCKCQAYESFVETCEERKQGPVKEWRMRHDCSKCYVAVFIENNILIRIMMICYCVILQC